MKLFVKSRLPSFPPVPSSEGHSGVPTSSSTTAAPNHSACGPRHVSRQVGIKVDLRDLNRRSAIASNRLKPELAFIWSASALLGGLVARETMDLIVTMSN